MLKKAELLSGILFKNIRGLYCFCILTLNLKQIVFIEKLFIINHSSYVEKQITCETIYRLVNSNRNIQYNRKQHTKN